MFRTIATLIACLVPALLFSQIAPADTAILARVGKAAISEQEFLNRFELTPGLYRHRPSQLDAEKLYFLYSMVAEKLLAQEALRYDLDRDSLFQKALFHLGAMLARDELYRREVQNKVSITPLERREGIRRALDQRIISYVFFPSKEDAEFVRNRLHLAADFDRLKLDSSMQSIRDTASIVWGDADTAIENATYRLRVGEISPVVHAGDGFYILKLVRSTPNTFYENMQPEVLSERVLKSIRLRKEHTRADEFLAEFMKHKTGYSPPRVFRSFAYACIDVLKRNPKDTLISETIYRQILASCKDILQDTLIVAESRSWNVHDALDRLYEKGFFFSSTDSGSVMHRLYDEFHDWVRLELLEQQAVREGLDRSAEVQQQLQPWRDQLLAFSFRNYMNNHVTVSDEDVLKYVRSTDTGFVLPQVRILTLHTQSLDDMKTALAMVAEGHSLRDAIVRYAGGNGGDTNFFPISERPPLGEIAWTLEPGQQYGPLQDSSGFVFFELLQKRNVSVTSDSLLKARLTESRSELLRMRRKRRMDLFLAQEADRLGVSLYDDRLTHLKVTAIPMLAYRLLGFGGRMFAVPFVDKQYDWVGVNPPDQQILP